MAHEVFLSHSTKDKAAADQVCAALEAAGVACWIAPRNILPGTHWLKALPEAIDASKLIVLLLSSHSNASVQVVRELTRAVNKGITILPFRLEAVEQTGEMDHLIDVFQKLDAFPPPLDPHLPPLIQAARQLL